MDEVNVSDKMNNTNTTQHITLILDIINYNANNVNSSIV